MNKYQFTSKTESGLGKVYYYCYADDRFEIFLNIKNIKYKKNWKNQGRNLFNELQQELQRKDNIINELKKCMKDLLNEANDKTSDLFIYEQNKAIINMFLDKIKELEEK